MGGIKGVEVRGTSIRIIFTLDGKQYKERLTVNGKAMLPTAPNLKYAARIANEVRRKIELGVFSWTEYFPDSNQAQVSKPTTFGKLADMWLDTKRNLVPGTLTGYANSIEMWKRMFGKDTHIDKITHQVLASKIGGYPWSSAQTVNNYLITLRGIMEFEYHGQKAWQNPMIGIKNFKKVRTLPDPLTPDERDLVLGRLKEKVDQRVYAYFLFAFYTGMRPEEIIALQWGDIDFRMEKARVARVKTHHGAERKGSKTHSERDVDLVSKALESLAIMKPYTFMKSDYIFENPTTGKPWADEQQQRNLYWKPALRHLGVRYRRPYNTRHTYATVALMAGVKPAYIAQQLGHANSKMVHEVYARWIEEADKGAEKLALKRAFGDEQIIPKLSQNSSGSS